jgi:hypothetical protein
MQESRPLGGIGARGSAPSGCSPYPKGFAGGTGDGKALRSLPICAKFRSRGRALLLRLLNTAGAFEAEARPGDEDRVSVGVGSCLTLSVSEKSERWVGREAEMDRRTVKLLFGSACVLFNLAVLLSGIWLIFACIPGIGEGEASATVNFLGKVSGLNGHAVGVFIGAAMTICSIMYTHKAYTEALTHETKSLPDIVRHHSPIR